MITKYINVALNSVNFLEENF